MTAQILLLSKYESLGGSSRYRFYQYLPYLKAQGFEIAIAPLLTNRYIQNLNQGTVDKKEVISACFQRVAELLTQRNYDLIWLEKELLPYVPAWLERLLIGKIPYIVDYDDATFHAYDRHPSPLIKSLLGRKIDRIMAHSQAVVAGNEYLAQRARKAGANRVEIIPTTIDLDRYSLKPESDSGRAVVNIGWIGSSTTTRFLEELAPVFEGISSRYQSEFTFVGASKKMSIPKIEMQIPDWHEQTEVKDIKTFDIGIMPLPDTAWARGKCGIKLIQYMACGLPVVGSPVGVNQEIVRHGVNGFHATTAEEWIEALSILASDTQLCRQMGAQGRKMVEEKYCLQVTAPKLAQILSSCAT
jgi:glycosyltransferase involved in cell wall biosynthesis